MADEIDGGGGEGEGRNYVAEMDARLGGAVPEGDFVVSVLAAKLAADLAEHDPDLFVGFCWAMAPSILGWRLRDLLKDLSRAAGSVTARQRSVFAALAKDAEDAAGTEHEAETMNALRLFCRPFVIDRKTNERRQLRKMDGENCLYVADTYNEERKQLGFRVAFFRAVAKRIGDRTVEEVYTAEQIYAMWNH